MRKLILGAKGSGNDLKAVILARLGFSVEAISKETNLTANQVRYRMQITDTKLGEYRNGHSYIAKRIISGADPYSLAKAEVKELTNGKA